MNVPSDMSPDGLVGLLTVENSNSTITLSDKDLPPRRVRHNKPLYLPVVTMGKNMPMTFVDNGSAINVCPLRTAKKIGIDLDNLVKSSQGVKAYDNTRRQSMGTSTLKVITGLIEKEVVFHVLDINTSFNLLLGRPWLHELKAVPSSLHQKVKLVIAGNPFTLEATPLSLYINTIQIEHDETDEDCNPP
ncbi:uncharacterized protein LOC110737586 [Chenopodium quinoa]|uniref:uncharacterized protein LOC110737586 n=1 Tax=Chenopodium quinoa TaxID=63459 RepID=UPI000B78985F|nr:uncharacterized protein LOC110737586 [Chenopodium quinoa]